MLRRILLTLGGGLLAVVVWSTTASPAHAQTGQTLSYQPLSRWYYYPYYYYPHSYWPMLGPKWPEPKGAPYMRPPAYMAYPPFMEPHWRYEWWMPQHYYRGFHFWLDQF